MEITLTIKFNPDTKDCQVTGPAGLLKSKELSELALELARGVMEQNRRRMVVSAPASVQLPPLGQMFKNGGRT